MSDQEDFHYPFRQPQRRKPRYSQAYMALVTILYLVLLVWAMILAMQTSKEVRTLNIVFALLAPPIYIIAHYVAQTVN